MLPSSDFCVLIWSTVTFHSNVGVPVWSEWTLELWLTLTSRVACTLLSDCFMPRPTCQMMASGGSDLNGHSAHSSSYHTVLQQQHKHSPQDPFRSIIVFFGSEGHVALDRYLGPGYNTLLLWLVPADLLSACPHRQFHTLPGLLDSQTALSNSYPNACIPSMETVCTIFMMVFGMTRPGCESMTSHMRGRNANHLAIPMRCNLTTGIVYTVFDLIGARGAYVNLFSTTSAKKSSSGRW